MPSWEPARFSVEASGGSRGSTSFSTSLSTSSSASNSPNIAIASSLKPTSVWRPTMARKDIRSNGRNIPLIHHSARGNVQRNSGNFTLGSQHLTHDKIGNTPLRERGGQEGENPVVAVN